MLTLRTYLNKTYIEEFKKATSSNFPELQKGGSDMLSEEYSLKIQNLMKTNVVYASI